jgi:hypothetical protein
VTWTFLRAHEQFGIPHTHQVWPDTETTMNLVLREAGVRPRRIGRETNSERHLDESVTPRHHPLDRGRLLR